MSRRLAWNVRAGLVLAGAMAIIVWPQLSEGVRLREALSRSSGLLGLLLIAASLALGPIRLLQGRPAAAHFVVRRDVGIWAAVLTGAHVAFGIRVHMRHWWDYFATVGTSGWPQPRFDAFGLTNWIGAGATLVALLLWGLSSDRAMRRLGAASWKRWQGWNYALYPMVLVHALIFELLEHRTVALLFAVVGLSLATLALQLVGRRRYREATNSRIESIT